MLAEEIHNVTFVDQTKNNIYIFLMFYEFNESKILIWNVHMLKNKYDLRSITVTHCFRNVHPSSKKFGSGSIFSVFRIRSKQRCFGLRVQGP